MALTTDGGGPPDSSGAVRDVKSRDAILVRPGGNVVDAATISATDAVYGTYFEFTLPKTDWRAQIIQVSASNYASYIQQIAQHDHVIFIYYAPDTNAAGLLIDTLVVGVATEDERSTSEVELPFAVLNTPNAFQRLDNAYDAMKKIEAIT